MIEAMGLTALIETNASLLLMALIILNVMQSTIIWVMYNTIKDIKKGITWGDTCIVKHKEIDRRLNKLETKVFPDK